MSLKTSFFNKSIIKSDFKRFWWVTALNTLVILVCFTFLFVYGAIESHSRLSADFILNTNYLRSDIFYNGQFATVMSLCFPPVLCVLIFSYLNSVKSAACLHGLPVKRSTFFWSHILSGFVMIIIPVIINVLVLLAFRLHTAVAQSYYISHLFIWAGQYIVYAVLAFAVTSAVMMITGNSVAGIIFTYIFSSLPFLAEAFIKFFCDNQIYGYSAESGEFISKFLYELPDDLYNIPLNILKYILFTVLLLCLAVTLYKHRRLENNGEIVAFPKLRYVFVYGVAVCAGAAGYAYLTAITGGNSSIWMLLPFGIVGIIIAEMIVKKSFKVKTVYKPIVIFCIFIGIVQLCFTTDIFGYERRLPKAADVQSIEFKCDVSYQNNYYTGYRIDDKLIVFNDADSEITNPETIDKIIKLHDNLIQARPNKESRNPGMGVEFTYKLKDGREISREYTAEYDMHKLTLQPVIETQDVRKIYFPVLKNNEKNMISMTIRDRRINNTGTVYYYENNKEIIDKLIAALKLDTSKTEYSKFVMRTPEYTQIDIDYKPYGTFEDGSEVPLEHLPSVNETYHIRDDYTNTLAVLNEIGFYKEIPKAEDIKEIGIVLHENKYKEASAETSFPEEITVTSSSLYLDVADTISKEKVECDKVITDANQIKEIYDYFGSEYRVFDEYDASMYINLKNGYTFTVEYNTEAEDIPDALK